jgi:hypothetical protein
MALHVLRGPIEYSSLHPYVSLFHTLSRSPVHHHHSTFLSMSGSSDLAMAQRRSRRLAQDDSTQEQQLVLPDDCDLVAGTFVVFRWHDQPCLLQVNVTLYCWGGQRSGALEMVLNEYGCTHSPQLHHVNSMLVTAGQWSWLRRIFIVVRRLFDVSESCDTVGKVHWLNIVECRLAYDLRLMRRQCYRYHCNLFPAASVLNTYLKRFGIELNSWYHSGGDEDETGPEPGTPATPPSSGQEHSDDTGTAALSGLAEREWLSDIHLANLMFLLLHGQLDLPIERRDDFQCFYPMTDQLFVSTLTQAEPGALLLHAQSGRGVTLGFVNPNNNHWRLIVLDGLQHQVVLFDPMGSRLPATLVRALRDFVGPSYRVVDLELHLQAESWNCGVWSLYVASRYITAALEQSSSEETNAAASIGVMDMAAVLQPRDDEYAILHDDSTATQRQQNRAFAGQLRTAYGQLLDDAATNGRLLYSADDAVAADDQDATAVRAHEGATSNVVRAGTARSAPSHNRRLFFGRSVAEQIWIDLTEEVVENEEEAMEQSLDDLCDHFIEFREDNASNPVAAALRYSLPIKLQSDVLKEQIEQFRAYRREHFSLFRRGPLVEETTIANNISSLLRFLGYLYYEQVPSRYGTALDMSVFALDNINQLVLSYVEWLERRRGNKRVASAAPGSAFQPVSCATVANYLNSLVAIVKFQLRDHQFHSRRDPLLDQLRNLRSQAESYSMTQKKFEKVHPEWCSWQELQRAREKCRSAFDELDEADARAYLLQLRELCLLCLFTICPPPRCSVIRLLEWDKTLVVSAGLDPRWLVDLTDIAHAATRHKTHKRKGPMQLPLPRMLSPYLSKLRAVSLPGVSAVFPRVSPSSNGALMDLTAFAQFVKRTFHKYTESGQAPNPSLLRSIFTTWLYSLRYDTEDHFLQQIKASSAKWKAHSERVAGTVYNKEQVYQKREFSLLLRFCEEYAERYAYDRPAESMDETEGDGNLSEQAEPDSDTLTRSHRRGKAAARTSPKRSHSEQDNAESGSSNQTHYGAEKRVFAVDRLIRIRLTGQGRKKVLVQWEGYPRPTWEPFDSIQQQLPKMVAELEEAVATTRTQSVQHIEGEVQGNHEQFLLEFIAQHQIGQSFRWSPDRLNALEYAATSRVLPIRDTPDQLRRKVMSIVRANVSEAAST